MNFKFFIFFYNDKILNIGREFWNILCPKKNHFRCAVNWLFNCPRRFCDGRPPKWLNTSRLGCVLCMLRHPCPVPDSPLPHTHLPTTSAQSVSRLYTRPNQISTIRVVPSSPLPLCNVILIFNSLWYLIN